MNHMFLVKHLSRVCHVVFPLPLVLHEQTSFVDNDCGIACQAAMFVFLVNICKAHIMCASRSCAVESPIKEEVFFYNNWWLLVSVFCLFIKVINFV